MKKTNYYYIDESGHINNNSKSFIHGCIKTDSPEDLVNSINKLKNSILEELYFYDTIAKIRFEKHGFHAVGNHPDIRTEFYKILPLLNYRAYFVFLNKTNDYFQKLYENFSESEIYLLTLKKLLIDRISKNKYDKNIFYFEQLEFTNTTLENILEEFFNSLVFKNLDFEYRVDTKQNLNFSIIDYLNYIFNNILENGNYYQKMLENYELIKPKIGSIYIVNSDKYFSRRSNLELKNILKSYGGELR